MRLGTFFGLTAPMLVLAYDDNAEQAVQTVGTLCKSVSKDIVQGLHEEFYFLLEAHKLLSVKFIPPGGQWFSEMEPDARIEEGDITGITCGKDVAIIELRNELTLRLAQKIVDREKAGKFVSISDGTVAGLESLAMDAINGGEFYTSEIPRIVNRMYKSVQSESGQSMTDMLVANFSSQSTLPDTILRNTVPLHLTDALTKIFQYFDSRRDTIQKLYEITRASTSGENMVFNLPFAAFMKRKPNYVEYVVIRWFKYLSGNRSESVLINIIDDISSNLGCLVSMVDTLVITNHNANATNEKFDTSIYEVSKEMQNSEDYTKEELRFINDIYCRVNDLTTDKIAGLLGITENEFLTCAKDACNVGICGLNAYSLALFQDTLPNIIISDGYVCQKSGEYMEDMKKSLDNVSMLLKNIKPLGALLEV